MPVKWVGTKFKGVRYYVSSTHRNGIRKDRYYAIRYQHDGVRKEEGLGWESEGWTAERSALVLADLKKAHTTGEGAYSLKEKRDREKARHEALEDAEKKAERERISFGGFFRETYYPIAQTSKKKTGYEKDYTLFKLWIAPILDEKPFKKIARTDIERIKKRLLDSNRSPKTIEHVFAVILQVWNMARRDGLITMDCPTKIVRRPYRDNKRLRFLKHEEADKILVQMKTRSIQLYNICLLSLHTGMRANEIFSLTWGDIDLDHGIITIRDPKAVRNRVAYMTSVVKKMFSEMESYREHDDLVFKDKRHGEKIKTVSNAFRAIVDELGLNKGISDTRQKVVFHSLRHTFASWLVENGTDLYIVKELMGHSTLRMTERYSHVGNNTLQNAIMNLERSLKQKQPNNMISIDKK
ncbi:MAG: tyrosine-type recombinase/integrase [Desulfomonilia bacterium]